MSNPTPPVVVVSKKRGWGCWGCGCVFALAVILLFLGLLFFSGRKAYRFAQSYTSTQPAAIPVADAGPVVYQSAERKLDAFEQAFEREQPATLHLNSDEINTLIARDPAWAAARGHVVVQLQGQTAAIRSSASLGSFETHIMADRYANTDATLGVSFDPASRRLLFNVQSLTLNGEALPANSADTVNQLADQMVNQQLQLNQLARDFMARVQKAGIENGELVIETK